jgi:serine/threonine-protein phosphatase 2A activator
MVKIDLRQHEFVVPQRGIMVESDMKKWTVSEAGTTLMDFIALLNQSVLSLKITSAAAAAAASSSSPAIVAILKVLHEMSTWTAEIPPLQQAQRFGNKAFKAWYERLRLNAPRFMLDIIASATSLASADPAALNAAAAELAPYLVESVGNATRIDYGTGHEMSFMAWMCGLHLIGVVQKEDFSALVFQVFRSYLDIMRSLQKLYMMEPAGSHGVWGLDDFQFLPFLWGSAQFIGNS